MKRLPVVVIRFLPASFTLRIRPWNGTLIDEACHTTHAEHKETTTTSANREEGTSTTRAETSHSEVTECPVTTTTTSLELLTPEGKYVRFDQPSNTKIVEVVKTNKNWSKYICPSTSRSR